MNREEARKVTKKGLRFEIQELEKCLKNTERPETDRNYVRMLIKAYKGKLRTAVE